MVPSLTAQTKRYVKSIAPAPLFIKMANASHLALVIILIAYMVLLAIAQTFVMIRITLETMDAMSAMGMEAVFPCVMRVPIKPVLVEFVLLLAL